MSGDMSDYFTADAIAERDRRYRETLAWMRENIEPFTEDDLLRLASKVEFPSCGTPSGKHIFDGCACDNDECGSEVCVWCGLVIGDGADEQA